MRYELADVSVDGAVAEASELLASHVADREIAFSYDGCTALGDSAPCVVRTDPARLRQILVNLIANAIKFTPRAGRVWVTCRSQERHVLIAVSDNGPGIPPDKLDSIFEPFVQIDRASTDTRHQGVGLGLAICRELVHGLDGRLTVESRLGEGSTFTVSLPAA